MHHDTFNADFYVTAATVIPVLYLALTLQGQTYDRIVRRFDEGFRNKSVGRWRVWRRFPLFLMFFIASAFILIAGIIGELTAISALYYRQISQDAATDVLTSLFVLVFAVAAGPAVRLLTVIGSPDRKEGESQGQALEKAVQPAGQDAEVPPE